MGASSQIISLVILMSFARSQFFVILQIETGPISMGIQNRECAILPPGNNVAAMPEEVVAKTISLLRLKFTIIVR